MISQSAAYIGKLNPEIKRYLADFRSPNCISVYLPTSSNGLRVQQHHDAKTLNSELRLIRKSMKKQGLIGLNFAVCW
ncbi:MAG: hypothetical protein RLZZ241_283 [Bacteroidota bacterium]|jgi:hypothetical protein